MSVYTIQLRNLVENGYPLFDFDYPIFDNDYRKVLEKKIVDRYYFREIGFETPGQFKHFLRTRLNEIMPYYNQLYKSENIMNKEGFNPLYNLDTTETQKRSIKSDSLSNQDEKGNSVSEGKGKNVFQDTPQSKLGDLNYATNITDDTNNQSASSNATTKATGQSNTFEEYENRVLGSGGLRYPADIIMEWRKSFLNIDTEILDNLNDLFMGVY